MSLTFKPSNAQVMPTWSLKEKKDWNLLLSVLTDIPRARKERLRSEVKAADKSQRSLKKLQAWLRVFELLVQCFGGSGPFSKLWASGSLEI